MTDAPGPSLIPSDLLETPTPPPAEAERPTLDPDAEEATEGIEFVRTGWVRCLIGGERYRLRPPLLRDFKALRFALEELSDSVGDLSAEVEIAAGEILEEQAAAEANPNLTARERVELRTALRKRSRDEARVLTTRREAETLAWFRLVFETLAVDDVSAWVHEFDAYPTWATSGALPHELIRHWRAAPLDRGRR